MDRSFIICGVGRDGETARPIAGVFFSNNPPTMEALCRLGFNDVQSVEEVKPLSKQPTEPTLYLFCRSPPPMHVEIIRLGWSGEEVGRARASGEPSCLVPPVEGMAAEKSIYAPKAFVISAYIKDAGRRSVPVVAVLFIKPVPGEETIQPDKKTLNRLGLVDLQTVERVETTARLPHSMLYMFEKTPAAQGVTVAKVCAGCVLGPAQGEAGEPHSVIPPISGSAADRFVNPRGGLGPGDFPKAGRQSDAPPSSKRQGCRRR